MKYVGYAFIAIGTLATSSLLFLSGFKVLDMVVVTPYIQMGIVTLTAGFMIVVINIGFWDDKR
jgi:hypothetical protein